MRNTAGIDPGLFESALELLWFKLPASATDDPVAAKVGDAGVLLSFGLGGGEAQLGWPIEKGSYPALRKRGIERLHERLVSVDPSLADVLPDHLTGFEQCSLLHVEPGISHEWGRHGLLLVGDTVPDALKRPLIRSLFRIVSRTPIPKRTRDTFMWGPTPVDVDTTHFTEVPGTE